MEEKELVQRSIKGDEAAFAMLVNRYKTKVFNLAFSLTRNLDTADDLSQEIFIKMYYALPRFRFKSELTTWLYQIAINHIKDHLRKKRKVKKVSFEDIREKPAFREEPMGKKAERQYLDQRIELIHQALKTLPKKHQIILSLRDIQGFSYEEIAQILKIAAGTVDSRIHRARQMLRKKLAPFLNQKGGSYEM